MKKKLSLMLCLCFMVLAMTACGTDPKSVDYFGMSYSDIQDNMEQTVSALVSFSDEDIQSGAEYEYNYETEAPELTDASADLVYSLGEKMEKAGMNTLMGMGTVFVVLILISLIISCFKVIPYLQNKKANAGAKKDVADPVVEQIEQREETSQLTDDLELVAVISAAIAAAEGTSADGFVVRSIHRR